MKRITKYIGLALAVSAFAASCNKNAEPVFNDKDAFVAFNSQTLSVSEDYSKDGDNFKIPVTLASVKGIETTVKFEVTSLTAKAGVNFSLETSSGVLTFNAENRTSYIEIKTLPDGIFTGDLQFRVEVFANEDVTTGSENICTVTINDIDHPLTALLGEYTMTGTKYGASAPVSWTMELRKDKEDVTKVWFYNMMGNSDWAGDDIMYYGIVDADKTKITVPFGQTSEYVYSNGNPVTLFGLDSELNDYEDGSLEITLTTDASGKYSMDFGEWGLWFYIIDAGGIGTYLAGTLSAVQN